MQKLPTALLILFLFGVSTHAAPKPQKRSQRTTVNSVAETEQWEAMKKRVAALQTYLSSSMWSLVHGYRSKEELDKTMNLFQKMLNAMAKDNPAQLRSIGGVQGFLNRFLGIMRSQRDDVVAGFAAKVLAVFGGPRYALDIAAILKGRDKSWTESVYPEPTVRGQAAIALSMLEATQYKEDIAALLQSMNDYDRSGAAHALATLKATEYAGEIAGLLSKTGSGFRRDESPIHALVNMGVGQQYKKEIAQALDEDFSSEVQVAAVYALAHLRALEYAPHIAKLLDDKYRRDDAAKGLAILGAKEYTKKIASMLDDENAPLDQAAALRALGILEANEYAPKAAQLMRDQRKSFVAVDAAESLILMGANDYLKEAASHFTVARVETYIQANDLHPLVEEEARQINQKFLTRLKELKAQR
jgi:HEAT repeat protein